MQRTGSARGPRRTGVRSPPHRHSHRPVSTSDGGSGWSSTGDRVEIAGKGGRSRRTDPPVAECAQRDARTGHALPLRSRSRPKTGKPERSGAHVLLPTQEDHRKPGSRHGRSHAGRDGSRARVISLRQGEERRPSAGPAWSQRKPELSSADDRARRSDRWLRRHRGKNRVPPGPASHDRRSLRRRA